MLLVGCIPGLAGDGVARVDAPPVPFPECVADTYEFVGESTFSALGLLDALPAEPPTPDRVAMIWITRDRLPFDPGEPGGGVQMTRMMCYEFPDGSGGSEWPVDDAWRLPTTVGGDSAGVELSAGWLLLGIVVVAAIGVSALAFRRRP
jgi:hypothetical protein